MSETFIDLVKRIAADCGHTISDDEGGYILWNHTGFPDFFDGDPEECCTRQLRDYFRMEQIDEKRRGDAYYKWVEDGGEGEARLRDEDGVDDMQVWNAACRYESSRLNGLYETAIESAREIFEVAYSEECRYGPDCFTEKREDDGHAPSCPLRLLGVALKNLPQSPGAGGTKTSVRVNASELQDTVHQIAERYDRHDRLASKMVRHLSALELACTEDDGSNAEIQRLNEELEKRPPIPLEGEARSRLLEHMGSSDIGEAMAKWDAMKFGREQARKSAKDLRDYAQLESMRFPWELDLEG